jgi:metallothiol transferase
MKVHIRGLNHLTLGVSSLDVSVPFYEHALGAKLLMREERFAYFDLAGLWIALNVQPKADCRIEGRSYTHVAFTVDADELPHLRELLTEIGVNLLPGREREEGEGDSLYFTDPDGHLFEFHTGTREQRLQCYQSTAAPI